MSKIQDGRKMKYDGVITERNLNLSVTFFKYFVDFNCKSKIPKLILKCVASAHFKNKNFKDNFFSFSTLVFDVRSLYSGLTVYNLIFKSKF